jgi:hypothetical protein
LNTFQINFTPLKDDNWKKNQDNIIKIVLSKYPGFIKKILLSNKYIYFKILFFPFYILAWIINLFFKKQDSEA